MQSVSSRIWTRITVSISYDENHYTITNNMIVYDSLILLYVLLGREYNINLILDNKLGNIL